MKLGLILSGLFSIKVYQTYRGGSVLWKSTLKPIRMYSIHLESKQMGILGLQQSQWQSNSMG